MTPTDSLDAARAVLRDVFGHEAFRPGQEEALRRILAGDDLTLVMPTGSGKSACFQLPALLRDGLTLVISPLIALMKDQVEGLQARGVPATFVNSTISQEEQRQRLAAAAAGRIRLLYVAPERLAAPSFVRMVEARPPSMVAVDEAHCISQWGHDFRPAYLGIKDFLARFEARRPQVVALTGTATPRVRADMAEQLGIPRDKLLMTGFRRENLRLVVRQCERKSQRMDQVLAIARAVPGTGIVYCGTRREVEDVASGLAFEGHDAGAYHAGLSDELRTQVQEDFLSGRRRIIVATNAFGMGIDKADVRFVVHHALPGSVEAYWQEAGRAGRDGKPSWCVLLWGWEDRHLHEFFLNGSHPPREQVMSAWHRLVAEGRDAIERSQRDLAEACGISDMAFGGALRLFEQAGLVEREAPGRDEVEEDGSRSRGRRILVKGRGLPHAEVLQRLADPLKRSAERRARGDERIRSVERYASDRGCRHRALLRYFGDDLEGGCAACDACCNWERKDAPSTASAASRAQRREAPKRTRLSDEDLAQARSTALRALSEIHSRFGVSMAKLVLRGSKSKKVLTARLDRSEAYGALARMREDEVDSLLQDLESEGLYETSGGLRPVVLMTEDGRVAAGT